MCGAAIDQNGELKQKNAFDNILQQIRVRICSEN